jgi:hypothetical protein
MASFAFLHLINKKILIDIIIIGIIKPTTKPILITKSFFDPDGKETDEK